MTASETQIEVWTPFDGDCFRHLFCLPKTKFKLMPPSSWTWIDSIAKLLQEANTSFSIQELLSSNSPAIVEFKKTVNTYLTGEYSWIGTTGAACNSFITLLAPYKRNIKSNTRYASSVWNDIGESLSYCLYEAHLLPKKEKPMEPLDMSDLTEEAKEILRRTANDYDLDLGEAPPEEPDEDSE